MAVRLSSVAVSHLLAAALWALFFFGGPGERERQDASSSVMRAE